ncbi:MAG: hypothetical protein ACRYGR_02425 [Janthinobacterium lividum]
MEKINGIMVKELRVEFLHAGGVRMAESCRYDVLGAGSRIICPSLAPFSKCLPDKNARHNDRFWSSADDKSFNCCLASKLGVAVPETVLLPHKNCPSRINTQSLLNLNFPLDWRSISDYVGFPSLPETHDGGEWRDVFHVHNPDEFFRAYDLTRDLCVALQAAMDFDDLLPLLCRWPEGSTPEAARPAPAP